MPKFVVEREIVNASNLSAEQLRIISQNPCGVDVAGTDIKWISSFITTSKIYCIYNASNEEMIREHTTKSGFPANAIFEIFATIDSTNTELSN